MGLVEILFLNLIFLASLSVFAWVCGQVYASSNGRRTTVSINEVLVKRLESVRTRILREGGVHEFYEALNHDADFNPIARADLSSPDLFLSVMGFSLAESLVLDRSYRVRVEVLPYRTVSSGVGTSIAAQQPIALGQERILDISYVRLRAVAELASNNHQVSEKVMYVSQ
jgi:hypothetical protein